MKYESLRDIEQRLSSNTYHNVFAFPHFHRSIELIFIEKGSVRARVLDEEHVFCEGEIIFVPNYFAHSVKAESESVSETFIIPYNFYSVFAERRVPLYYFRLCDKEKNQKLFKIVKEIKELLKKTQPILVKALTEVLLGYIAKEYPPEYFDRKENSLMINIIEYLELNYKQPLSLELVARYFGYNKYYFSKLFNDLFGCHLTMYINRLRANYVLDNMSPDRSVTALIQEAGFGDSSTFYRTKKRIERV